MQEGSLASSLVLLPCVLQVQLPQYVDYVKTGAFKELAPLDPDWYYIRAGALQPKRGAAAACSNLKQAAMEQQTPLEWHAAANEGDAASVYRS